MTDELLLDRRQLDRRITLSAKTCGVCRDHAHAITAARTAFRAAVTAAAAHRSPLAGISAARTELRIRRERAADHARTVHVVCREPDWITTPTLGADPTLIPPVRECRRCRVPEFAHPLPERTTTP